MDEKLQIKEHEVLKDKHEQALDTLRTCMAEMEAASEQGNPFGLFVALVRAEPNDDDESYMMKGYSGRLSEGLEPRSEGDHVFRFAFMNLTEPEDFVMAMSYRQYMAQLEREEARREQPSEPITDPSRLLGADEDLES